MSRFFLSLMKRKWGRKGVTLFEVMVALALFAIIITPVMRSFITSVSVNKKSREVMIATDVANSIMEGISGKTYEDVMASLRYNFKGDLAVDPSVGSVSSSHAKYAMSSINDNWYNKGNRTVGGVTHIHAATDLMPFIGQTYTTKYKNNYEIPSGTYSYVSANCVNGTVSDQALAQNAMKHIFNTYYGGNPNPNATTVPLLVTDTAPADKLFYYGFSWSDYYLESQTGADDGYPKLAYLLYSRIEQNGHYYDATVTFIPRAQNVRTETVSKNIAGVMQSVEEVRLDDYFTYEVTVRVYEYRYDSQNGVWAERFVSDGSSVWFDGPPLVTLTSGIMNKKIN
ncbi:MAG: prepilin-type N-terminal cleavage/methylation domain-containing protein [Lachnospiraceae bacterium]|nr:prepilin-type N-terminal cleavage/methylation domain-containing protein [Lachnospiraceae bacterium]